MNPFLQDYVTFPVHWTEYLYSLIVFFVCFNTRLLILLLIISEIRTFKNLNSTGPAPALQRRCETRQLELRSMLTTITYKLCQVVRMSRKYMVGGVACQTIRSIMKPVFRRYRRICYTYESLRRLDLQIW